MSADKPTSIADIEAAAAAQWPGTPMVRRGHTLRVGSHARQGGGSVVVELEGERRGVWYDFAAGEGGTLLGGERASGDALPTVRPRPKRFERDADKSRILAGVLAKSRPILDTPGELYLQNRHIDLRTMAGEIAEQRGQGFFDVVAKLPIRYLPPDRERGHVPAVAFLAQTDDGETVAAQLVAITEDGRKDRLEDVVKRTLVAGRGWQTVGAVNLPALGSSRHTHLVAEGPETALSLWQATGYRTSSALGPHLGQMSFLGADRVVLCRDAAAPGSDDDGAAWRAARQIVERGFPTAVADVRLVGFGTSPHQGNDFNDLLVKRGPEAVRTAVEAAVTVTAERCERRIQRWQDAHAERMKQTARSERESAAEALVRQSVTAFEQDVPPERRSPHVRHDELAALERTGRGSVTFWEGMARHERDPEVARSASARRALAPPYAFARPAAEMYRRPTPDAKRDPDWARDLAAIDAEVARDARELGLNARAVAGRYASHGHGNAPLSEAVATQWLEREASARLTHMLGGQSPQTRALDPWKRAGLTMAMAEVEAFHRAVQDRYDALERRYARPTEREAEHRAREATLPAEPSAEHAPRSKEGRTMAERRSATREGGGDTDAERHIERVDKAKSAFERNVPKERRLTVFGEHNELAALEREGRGHGPFWEGIAGYERTAELFDGGDRQVVFHTVHRLTRPSAEMYRRPAADPERDPAYARDLASADDAVWREAKELGLNPRAVLGRYASHAHAIGKLNEGLATQWLEREAATMVAKQAGEKAPVTRDLERWDRAQLTAAVDKVQAFHRTVQDRYDAIERAHTHTTERDGGGRPSPAAARSAPSRDDGYGL